MLFRSGGSGGKASVYNAGDLSSIPGSGRAPGEGNGKPLHILAWRIAWTEESGGLQSTGSQRVGHYRVTNIFTFFLYTSVLHTRFLESMAIQGGLQVPQGRKGKPQILLDRHLPLLSGEFSTIKASVTHQNICCFFLTNYSANQK